MNRNGDAVLWHSSANPVSDPLSPPCETRPFYAKVIGNERITAAEHWQDVRLLTFDIHGSNIKYSPGDVLMVRPQNMADTVVEFMNLLGLEPDAAFTVQSVQTAADVSLCLLPQPCTIRQLVTDYLDINAIPRRYFWELMSIFTDSDIEREKLQEFCTTDGQEELYSYCNRPRRTILEVLRDFPHVTSNIPFEYLFDMIGPMQPRAFSIASSQKVNKDQIQLIVAVVKYKSKLLVTPRRGVCSTYLANLNTCTDEQPKVAVWVEAGTINFPKEPDIPVIMIGPGTGCAPFRSFIQERVSQSVPGSYLFFGCRNKDKDFYCQDEWQRYESESMMRLFVAFSRDQDHKIYVQHVLAAQADLVWQLIDEHKAWFFVAGNAKNMPESVRSELQKIVVRKGNRTVEDADNYLNELDRSHRYQAETWS
jgi:sulfite reductase alpha subunit-like flavoprotein